jgi:predicted RNase H-like HicB family nuclease
MGGIIFEVTEDGVDGGCVATALAHVILTQGNSIAELREMVKDAVPCHFGDGVPEPVPKMIRRNFARDELLAA